MVARSGRLIEASPGPGELDELAHHAVRAQQLHHRQRDVGGGGARLPAADEAYPDHLRRQHVVRLPEQGGLRLDAPDPPAEHAEAVDHGGVRVGAHQGIGVHQRRRGGVGRVVRIDHHHAGQVLEVHLVHDAGRRRHHAEVGERALPPVQELEALAVAAELDFRITRQRVAGAEVVHLHRMVEHQVHRRLRVDPGRGRRRAAPWRHAWRPDRPPPARRSDPA